MAPLRLSLSNDRPADAVQVVQNRRASGKAKIPPDRKIAISLAEFAELTSVSIPTARQWIREGCPCLRAGSGRGRLLVMLGPAKAWLQRRLISLAEDTGDVDPAEVVQ